jgi:hypothetical protein
MNISLLIDRWEKRRNGLTACCQKELDLCISELKMMASGELREPNRLDTVCHFKKWKGHMWKVVIEEDAGYVNWCMENVQSFELDETAHNYLIENGG